MTTDNQVTNDAGIPPKYQIDVQPRRKGDPVKPEHQITPDKIAHIPQEVYRTETFQDHRGEQCLTCYRGRVRASQEPLIPPWSYQFYIVTGLEASDARSFCEGLFKTLITTLSYNEIRHVRFDFSFLPGASNIDCMQHYWREKDSARQQGRFAIPTSYQMSGRAKGRSTENALVVVDDERVESKGLVWHGFADCESYDGVPTSMNSREQRSGLERNASPWIGEAMDEAYMQSNVRPELEKEFKLATGTQEDEPTH